MVFKQVSNIVKLVPMIMSLSLHGRSSDTNLCKHFLTESVDILDLKPSIRYVHVKPNDDRDFRFNYETFQIGYDDSHLIDKLDSSKFKSDLPTKILVHGFHDKWPYNEEKTWIDNILKELTISNSYNGNRGYNVFVLSFDHDDIIDTEGWLQAYTKMQSTVQYLGRYLGKFLFQLNKLRPDVNLSTFHFIGHSLGAHLAGFTGKTLQELSQGKLKLGYISGLDPAGPCFEDNEPDMRLDSSDAIRVDVIHSNMGGFGIKKAIGHVDVTLNNGVMQPGTDGAINSHSESVWRLFSNHQEGCQLLAYKCQDRRHFVMGDCSPCLEEEEGLDQNCICYKHWPDMYQPSEKMLKDSRNSWIKEPTGTHLYFTSTRETNPFCHHILQVVVKSEWDLGLAASMEIANDSKQQQQQSAKQVAIYRSTRMPTIIANNNKLYHRYTGLVEYPVESPFQFSPITQVTLFGANLQQVPVKNLKNNDLPIEITIEYRSNTSPEIRKSLSSHLCPILVNRTHAKFSLCP